MINGLAMTSKNPAEIWPLKIKIVRFLLLSMRAPLAEKLFLQCWNAQGSYKIKLLSSFQHSTKSSDCYHVSIGAPDYARVNIFLLKLTFQCFVYVVYCTYAVVQLVLTATMCNEMYPKTLPTKGCEWKKQLCFLNCILLPPCFWLLTVVLVRTVQEYENEVRFHLQVTSTIRS